MSDVIKTRFAPSPTGFLHLGNVRTALFNVLLARARNGVFLLRIEDTDQARSTEEFYQGLLQDLRWLGLHWQEGPEAGGAAHPYRQSQRDEVYRGYFRHLEDEGHAYPCFCSEQELKLARKAQLAAGRPPRYAGKCAALTPQQVQTRLAQGAQPVLRFRVPHDAVIAFEDLVRGAQRFDGADIGDFVIRRADGSAAFFFSNALDDALMGITHVLRGEDHLANTPRQILLLEALGLRTPRYGHIAMLVGRDGAPLSKRHGSRSARELQEEGYLPEAVINYLARLGHHYESDALLEADALAALFEIERLGRAPACFDTQQLLHWQHKTIAHATTERLWAWMGEEVQQRVGADRAAAFVAAVRGNVAFPAEAAAWAQVVFADPVIKDDVVHQAIEQAGSEFFRQALSALELYPDDYPAFVAELKLRSAAKGKVLFMPLRAALTGRLDGPELAQLWPLLGRERIHRRLAECIILEH